METPRTTAVINENTMTGHDYFHLANALEHHARQLEMELIGAREALRILQPEVTAWIATSERGSVMHFSKADGWEVKAVGCQPQEHKT